MGGETEKRLLSSMGGRRKDAVGLAPTAGGSLEGVLVGLRRGLLSEASGECRSFRTTSRGESALKAEAALSTARGCGMEWVFTLLVGSCLETIQVTANVILKRVIFPLSLKAV